MRWIVVLCVMLHVSPGEAAWGEGQFVNMAVALDADIGDGNDGDVQMDPPAVGSAFGIQVFVPAAADGAILGYEVAFGLANSSGQTLDIRQHLRLESASSWDGSNLNIRHEQSSVALLSLSAVTVPSSGYFGTVVFSVTGLIEEDFILFVISASIGDAQNRDLDALTTSDATILFSTQQEIIEALPGDFDRDGDVDFSDFLEFTKYFGQTGPVPTPPTLRSGGSTKVVTVTVHDTVYVNDPGANVPEDQSPQRTRAEILLGYLTFVWNRDISDECILFGLIYDPDEDDPTGELVVEGSDRRGNVAKALWVPDQQRYFMFHHTSYSSRLFEFNIQNDVIVGKVYRYNKISRTKTFESDLEVGSGRGRTQFTWHGVRGADEASEGMFKR